MSIWNGLGLIVAKGGIFDIFGDLAQRWHNFSDLSQAKQAKQAEVVPVPGDGWWIGAEVGGDMVLTSEGSQTLHGSIP